MNPGSASIAVWHCHSTCLCNGFLICLVGIKWSFLLGVLDVWIKCINTCQGLSWHHQINGHEFEHILGDSEGQGSLACCSPWYCKDLDMTEWLNNHKSLAQCLAHEWSGRIPYSETTSAGSPLASELVHLCYGLFCSPGSILLIFLVLAERERVQGQLSHLPGTLQASLVVEVSCWESLKTHCSVPSGSGESSHLLSWTAWQVPLVNICWQLVFTPSPPDRTLLRRKRIGHLLF